MKKSIRGFGLIELMIAMVLLTIVMAGIYRFWIKSTMTMGDKIAIGALKQKAQYVFETITTDLKFIGYNPREITDASNNLIYRIRYHSPYLPATSTYNRLIYSFYNENVSGCESITGQGTCVSAGSAGNNTECDCIDYELDLRATSPTRYRLIRRSNSTTVNNQKIEMTLLNNACVMFAFCDVNDLSGKTECTSSRQALTSGQPKMMKLILAAGVSASVASDFAYGGCLASTSTPPYRPCCDSLSGNFKEGEDYVRFEKLIKLDNLR